MKLAKRNEIGLVHYEQEDAAEIYEEVGKGANEDDSEMELDDGKWHEEAKFVPKEKD